MTQNQDRPTQSTERCAFVVDDDAQFRALVARNLESLGFTALQLELKPQVEAALTKHRPEVIVLDLSLGKSDAVEVLQCLAAAHFGGKVLLVSGHDASVIGEVHKVGERLRLSMLDFLHKPFRLGEFKARLACVIDAAAVSASDDFDLESALKNNWLEVWYQPQINLQSNLLCGAEALIRLRHPKFGITQPQKFLPPKGDALFTPLTDFVLRRSLVDWKLVTELKIVCPLSINTPVSVIQRDDFVTKLRDHLPDSGNFPGITIEITESEAITHQELVHTTVSQLKLYGVEVSIDDFGVEHSNMTRFGQIPFAEVKLDRKFVKGCATDKMKQDMCMHTFKLAKHYNMRIVAEGIDNFADFSLMKTMKYDVGQGYYFSKPMIIEDFVNMALSRDSKKSRSVA